MTQTNNAIHLSRDRDVSGFRLSSFGQVMASVQATEVHQIRSNLPTA